MLTRGVAAACLLGAALVAHAVGSGDVTATPEVTIITIASPTGTGAGTATLQNTTTATTYNVLVGSDASCDPQLTFSIAGGNPTAIAAGGTKPVQLTCPARGTAAMRRCLYHAKNAANGGALADFMSVCLYGSSATVTPAATTVSFGSVGVGDNAMQQLALKNDGTQPITRISLQTTDLAGNFQFSTPCNPDDAFCDAEVAAVAPGASLSVQIRCTPQTPGVHTAQLYVGTNTYQLLAQPVTLTCTGTAAATPVLGVSPTAIDLVAPLEVTTATATTTIHVANAGTGTLLINDVRIVDVDSGAATDWTYTASGECTGLISAPCSLDAGELVDLDLTFAPSTIGRRRATMLISYRDTIDRTKEIRLGGASVGATLETVRMSPPLVFGMVPIGRSSTMTVDLVNRGNRDLTAQLAFSAGGTPPFAMMPSASIVLPPNMAKPLAVTCTPTTATTTNATISAQAMDAFGGTTLAIDASCEGSTLPVFANPSAVDFGEIRIGSGPVRRTIQLGAVSSPVTLTGQPELESAATTIQVGALSQMTTPASFEVTIEPQTQGDIATQILVATADGTLRIPIVGRAVTVGYEVAPALELGTFCVGQATSSVNASLVSTGTGSVALMQPTLPPGSPFSLVNTAPTLYPTALATGKTATVAVTPDRQSTAGALATTLTWHTDVDDKPTADTAMAATFIDQGGAIAPRALDFGKVRVHLFQEDGQRVIIQNCNPTPLVLDPPMIKTPFQIDSPNFPAMLNPNETATFSVGFHPTRIGRVVDTLRITSPQLVGAPLEVMLVGEGVTTEAPSPDAGIGGGGGDGGCCSSTPGVPARGWPVLAAIALVIVRRRRGSSRAR